MRSGLSLGRAAGGCDAAVGGGCEGAAAAGGCDGAVGGAEAAAGDSERGGMTGAMPSSVCLRSGLLAAGGADAAAVGADEGRGAGTEDARGAGTEDACGAGTEDEGRGGEDEARCGAGVVVAGGGAGSGAVICGTRAGAGMSSAPHSESMSSVGGAIDGIGGRPLTRSLGLSVIA